MICGMNIGHQSTCNMLENRKGAITESERGLAKLLRLGAAQLDDFVFEECQLKGGRRRW